MPRMGLAKSGAVRNDSVKPSCHFQRVGSITGATRPQQRTIREPKETMKSKGRSASMARSVGLRTGRQMAGSLGGFPSTKTCGRWGTPA